MEPHEYTKYSNTLQLGSSIKVPHEGCSSSNALKITHGVDGLIAHCFKCGDTCFVSNYNSPREKLKRLKIVDEQQRIQAESSNALPADFSHSIPHQGLAWLGRGGWTQSMISLYNIGYSKKLHRVILPVVDNCIHKGYTARAIDSWQYPKYLEKLGKDCLWSSKNESGRYVHNDVVLCEDILSAGRCGNYIQSYALLGTSLGTNLLTTFCQFRTVYIWLDPDKGGTQGTIKLVHRLRLIHDDVQVIRSDVDPKLLQDDEIKEILNVKGW